MLSPTDTGVWGAAPVVQSPVVTKCQMRGSSGSLPFWPLSTSFKKYSCSKSTTSSGFGFSAASSTLPWPHYFCATFLFTRFFFFFCFLGPYPQHMEVPRLGVESELQLLAYITATAMQGPSDICNLHHSSRQRQIFFFFFAIS